MGGNEGDDLYHIGVYENETPADPDGTNISGALQLDQWLHEWLQEHTS